MASRVDLRPWGSKKPACTPIKDRRPPTPGNARMGPFCGGASASSRYTPRADRAMPSSKSPLKPLRARRERQVEDATAELGGAVRAREAAEAGRSRAET